MCLWFVQMCPECETFTPISERAPIQCTNVSCLRKSLNPNTLTKSEQDLLLCYDDICTLSCNADDCGLLSRLFYCGQLDALRSYCPTDSEPSASNSDDDDFINRHFTNVQHIESVDA